MDLANSIQLKNGTTNLYPVTSDTLVYDSNGINLNQKITDINNTTLKKSDLSDSVTNASSTTVATSNAVKQAYDRAEQAFQLGNNVKQNLVDTLIAKGSEVVSTSNSWEEIIEMINNSNINLATPVYTVEDVGAPYGFVLREEDYYESTNNGVDSSYAMCKVVIPAGKSGYYYMDCINYGENNYDYGIISTLNQTLPMNNDGASSTSTTVLHTFYDSSSPDIQTVSLGQLPDGGFFYVKYRKDNITDEYNDTLKFKVRLSDKEEGGGGDYLKIGEVVEKIGFLTQENEMQEEAIANLTYELMIMQVNEKTSINKSTVGISPKYNMIKKWYEKGYWTSEMVLKALEYGQITQDEYNDIIKAF